MPKLIVFVKKDCPQCPLARQIAKEVAKELGLEYKEIDIERNMITALMYNVISTPSIAFDEEVLFRGEVPDKRELVKTIKRIMGKIKRMGRIWDR